MRLAKKIKTMKKTAYNTEHHSEVPTFNWGLKLEDVKELFYVTGINDCIPDGENVYISHPGDPVGQTKKMLAYMEEVFTKAGFTKDDIVYVDWVITKEVTREQAYEIVGVWIDYIKDVKVKPAAGIFKCVDRLVHEGLLVEFEYTLAR